MSGGKDRVEELSRSEFEGPITEKYAEELSEIDPADLVVPFNPGPTNDDGSVNFECHCVGHLVASPCGHEFRQAISCQKMASEKDLEEGACAEEFVRFMQCVVETQCFKHP